MSDDRAAQLQSLSIDRSEPEASNSPLKVIVAMVLAALVSVLITWWWMNGQIKQVRSDAATAIAAAQENIPVSGSSAPATAPRASGLVASGYVTARRQATVSAEITGTIREILFDEGSKVEAGQVLARLDDKRAIISLRQAKAQTESARRNVQSLQARIVEADIVLGRAQTLADKAIGPKAAVTAAAAALKTLQAQLAGARADLAASKANVASQVDLVERHVVRAPYAGVVIAKNAQVGEILSPSSAGGGFTRTGIATIVDMQSLEIEVDVNEGQIGRVSPGQKVEAVLDAYQNWKIPAQVVAIIPTANRARATIKVRVSFDEIDARVLPDMAVKVTFIE
ncbi:MAG: efflux transporter periplasmic adaptor subunit [Robiginitomaculum sp.]|nr:MAG: efflux transporter periplasmic adaptor subunit [Robiginitomaculum sp.]